MASVPLVAIFIIICLLLVLVDASSFLFMLPVTTFSHHVYLMSFWQQLTARGHQVTVMTSNDQFKADNVTFVHIKMPYDVGSFLNDKAYGEFRGRPAPMMLALERSFGLQACETLVQNKILQHQIKNGEQYDVVFVTSVMEDCNFPIAALLTEKIVVINFMRQILPQLAYNLGFSTPYSFSPTVISHLSARMSFGERLWNTLVSAGYVFWFREYSKQEEIIQTVFPNAPDLATAFGKVSLIFANSDDVLSEPVPRTSNVVKISGMHIKKPKPLPESFKEAVSGENGFILFSMGTLAEMTNAGPNILQAFIDAFDMLNETIIWKTRENYTNLPANVKTFPWIPQQDVLGHANIRLFITQGGIFGLQEAIYNAVPILGIPLIVDQFSNMKRLDELGIGRQLYMFGNLTANDIFLAVRSIIDDPSFKENITHYSEIFKDVSDSPLDRAIFWTEWLTRHPDITKITHPSSQSLNIIRYFLLDVIAVLFFVLLSPVIILFVVYKYVK